MAKQKKHKKKRQSVVGEVSAPLRQELKEKARAFNWRMLLIVLVNTVVLYTVYKLLMRTRFFLVTMILYMVVTTALICVYCIYNRGMSRRNVTPDMLPDDWSAEQKAAYIEDGRARLRASKWMLMIIVPLVLVFLFDSIELFWGDLFAGFFAP